MRKEPFKHLLPRQRYKIVKVFVDFDGLEHQPGRLLTFIGSSFLPHDDGLTLYFEYIGEQISFRLQWREEAQAVIIENLENYFVCVE
jgi:hypothetical protein